MSDDGGGPEIEFYGAAGQVTGSCHILRYRGRTVLLDCGLIQGGHDQELRNTDPFPFQASEVDAVVLSHAHLDHAGRLPLLVKRGFTGTIHTHNATRALMRLLLNDAADIEMSVIRRENRRRADQGKALLSPLYIRDDVDDTLDLTQPHAYDQSVTVVPGMTVRFHDAGHIMGSAVVEVRMRHGDRDLVLVFSGDLGQYGSPILRDPVTPPAADVVLMETTYGDRRHRDRQASLVEFGEVLAHAHRVGGNVLIPAFAVGRSQEILYQLGKYYDEWDVGRWQVFLDSPLAIEASEVYWDFEHLFDTEAAHLFREGAMMPRLPNLHLTRTADESKVIGRLKRGAIIIAGSGMCNGGRILHHLRREVGRKETQVVFTGYQPPGTLGRRIIDGVETVRIHGDNYPVRAEVHTIGGLSAHGDQHDLIRWLEPMLGTGADGGAEAPRLYLVHGDPDAAAGFAAHVQAACGISALVAAPGDRMRLADLSPR
ncbi:MAG: MBL fold metallo-hydrolase [Pseudomonadales bacterium]